MELTEKQYDKILEKQCNMVGVNYKHFFALFLEGKVMPKEWYLKHSWTEKQEKEFEEWLIEYLKKIKSGWSKSLLVKYVSWWILDYGWTIKENI